MKETLRVNGNTTLTDLHTYLSKAGSHTIRGRKDGNGNIILYAKSRKDSVLDRVLFRRDERRENTRKAFLSVFNNAVSGEYGNVDRVDLALEGARSNLASGFSSGLRANHAKKAIGDAMELEPRLPRREQRGPSLQGVGLKPNWAPLQTFAKSIAQSTTLAGGKIYEARLGAVKTFASELSDHIAPRGSMRSGFADSSNFSLKEELCRLVKQEMGAQIAREIGDDGVLQIVSRAVDLAAAGLPSESLSGKVSGDPVEVDGVKLDCITFDDKQYKPAGFLGEGGFADVYEYVNVSDPSDSFALKVMRQVEEFDSNEEDLKKFSRSFDEAVREIRLHNEAAESSDNVVGFRGALRLPDGRLCIAVELAPNGMVSDMSGTIREAVAPAGGGSPKITTEEANILRLTMIRDMAQGLKDMHDTGLTHYDFKSPNCLIASDGSVKIADFGLTVAKGGAGGSFHLDETKSIDNPMYKAPEIFAREAAREKIVGRSEGDVKATRQGLAEMFPNLDEGYLNTLTSNILAARKRREDMKKTDELLLTGKVDVWGLGASALELFTGKLPFDDKQQWNLKANALLDFGMSDGGDPLDALGDGKLTSGDDDIDELLSGMLAAKPEDRRSPKEILASDALKRKGIGGPEAKALIVALKGGDANAISAARRNLQQVMK